MSNNKVYVLTLESHGASEFMFNRIGRKITIIGDILKEDIHFHSHDKNVVSFGEPVMIVECSEKVLGHLQKEAVFKSITELPAHLSHICERSSALFEQYRNATTPVPKKPGGLAP